MASANGGAGESISFELLAAALRADTADLGAWVAALGAKLAGALPDRVQVRHSGIFGNGPVTGMVADLGEWRFALHVQHGRPMAERAHIVRGIALKTEQVSLDAWIDALSQSLSEIAATSARERAALQRLLS